MKIKNLLNIFLEIPKEENIIKEPTYKSSYLIDIEGSSFYAGLSPEEKIELLSNLLTHIQHNINWIKATQLSKENEK